MNHMTNAKICKKKIENKYLKDKKYNKVRDHCHYKKEYRGTPHSIYNLKCSVPKKFLTDNYFIMKEFYLERV